MSHSGSGFLTLPWAFHQTGPILGCIVLAVFAWFSIVAVVFILEANDRANTIRDAGRESELPTVYNELHAPTTGYRTIKDKDSVFEVPDSNQMDAASHLHSIVVVRSGQSCRVEMTELCRMFLGERAKQAFACVISVYMYGTLWAYITVFAKAFAIVFNFSTYSYELYLVLFAFIVVPLSLMELSEQVYIQVTLAVFRVVMVVVMISTTSIAYLTRTPAFGELSNMGFGGSSSSSTGLQDGPPSELLNFNASKLYQLLPLAAYAYIFHHSVTALSEPIADRRDLTKMFAISLLVAFIGYTLLAIALASYFGPNVLSSSNLNWIYYVGSKKGIDDPTPYYAQVIALFVILFPALDVASAYPLNAFTLGNNLMSSYFGDEIQAHEKSRLQLSGFRLLASLPPFVGAFFVSDLGHITSFTGLTGFVIAFIVPPLLAYYSNARMKQLELTTATVHSSAWASTGWQYAVCSAGVMLTLGVAISCVLATD